MYAHRQQSNRVGNAQRPVCWCLLHITVMLIHHTQCPSSGDRTHGLIGAVSEKGYALDTITCDPAVHSWEQLSVDSFNSTLFETLPCTFTCVLVWGQADLSGRSEYVELFPSAPFSLRHLFISLMSTSWPLPMSKIQEDFPFCLSLAQFIHDEEDTAGCKHIRDTRSGFHRCQFKTAIEERYWEEFISEKFIGLLAAGGIEGGE